MPLQRVIVDFAADESYEKAQKKILEHYRIDIPKSSIRVITLTHSQKIKKLKKHIQKFDRNQPIVDCIISEADGTMTPIVVIDKTAPDKRKSKSLIWREARLVLAYKKGSIQPVYEASYGTTDEVGNQIAYCVKAAGKNKHSKVHFVGDGAPWIADQVEMHFGDDASYLIDYYHMTQYLAAASKCCSPLNQKQWRKDMQCLMKEGKLATVHKHLKTHLDETLEDHECNAKKCYNYVISRLNQFDYKGALEQGLPIGSGRVESGHRNVIQKRLKVAGAWWKEQNADAMLALRIIRENGFWGDYWSKYATRN